MDDGAGHSVVLADVRRVVASAALAAAAASSAWRLRHRLPGPPARWLRTNHRGDQVSLAEGPAATAGLLAGLVACPALTGPAAAAAVAGAGAFGLLDDLGERGSDKGLRGHLGALAHGRVTTGGAKIAGIAAASALAARRLAPAASIIDVGVATGVIAGSANLANLFDLRPGRALKVSLVAAAVLAARGGDAARLAVVAGATSAALLPVDLGERGMLGDCGANALGALLGCASVTAATRSGAVSTGDPGQPGAAGRPTLAGRPALTGLLAAVVALTLASEKVSFTTVIEATPGLREADAWGRRPRP